MSISHKRKIVKQEIIEVIEDVPQTRVTKWLHKNDLAWCFLEAARIEENTGDKCEVIMNKDNSKCAVQRQMFAPEGIYGPY